MAPSIIKQFSVFGLFETFDVHINFQDAVKIIVGENGIGKTQVLNLFYYTLTRDFSKLSEYNFQKLSLTFFDGESIEITKKEVENFQQKFSDNELIKDVISKIGLPKLQELSNSITNEDRNSFYHNHKNVQEDIFSIVDKTFPNRQKYKLSVATITQAIFYVKELSKIEKSIFASQIEKIDNCLPNLGIMYFPTFRRVEEDLHNLGYAEEDLKFNSEKTLIQFGMDDVQQRFLYVENQIERLLKEGLSVFLKDMLKIVLGKKTNIDESIFERINEDDLKIIFTRAKDLDIEIKEAVLDSVRKKEFNDPLSGLILQKLVELYENQKELDKAIILFRDTCNKYLINKEVFYDESGIKIFIKSTLTGKKIMLKHLSSGEKQIISIFSKIYLSDSEERFIILFDEPELSLSMTWQKMLLPDIMQSQKCDFLLAVTHSPFIFDNELDQYAVGLNEYIQPIKTALAE